MNLDLYKGTIDLIKLFIKRNKLTIFIWLVSLTFVTVVVAGAFTGLYSSPEEMFAMAETMRNPAMTAMVGPSEGLDNYHVGAQMSHQMLLFTAMAVGVMSILIVTKNTRADEEDGLIEMIRSLPVGRLSISLAITKLMVSVYIIMTILIAAGLYLTNIENITLHGSILYASTLAITGVFFAVLTLIISQLTENSRGTIGYSFGFLLVAYFLRAIGDVSSEFLSLISPLGLILRTHPYVLNNWWPILIMFVISIILFGLALYLNSIRDLGSGFIPSKGGHKNASSLLKKPIGFYMRLQRTSIIAWLVTMLLLGISYGSIFGDLEQFILSNEMIQQMIDPESTYTLSEQFMTLMMMIMSIMGTIPALMFVLKPRSEEKKKRLENIITKSVSRNKMLFVNLSISLVFGLLMLLVAGLGLYLASSSVMESPILLSTTIKAILVYFPAMAFMVGLALLLNGYFEKFTYLIWGYLVYTFFVSYLGNLLDLPELIIKTTPFSHIPNYPVEEIKFVTLAIISVIAILFMVMGFIGFNKRDIKE